VPSTYTSVSLLRNTAFVREWLLFVFWMNRLIKSKNLCIKDLNIKNVLNEIYEILNDFQNDYFICKYFITYFDLLIVKLNDFSCKLHILITHC
jgi:hypothetical protein